MAGTPSLFAESIKYLFAGFIFTTPPPKDETAFNAF